MQTILRTGWQSALAFYCCYSLCIEYSISTHDRHEWLFCQSTCWIVIPYRFTYINTFTRIQMSGPCKSVMQNWSHRCHYGGIDKWFGGIDTLLVKVKPSWKLSFAVEAQQVTSGLEFWRQNVTSDSFRTNIQRRQHPHA